MKLMLDTLFRTPSDFNFKCCSEHIQVLYFDIIFVSSGKCSKHVLQKENFKFCKAFSIVLQIYKIYFFPYVC